MNDVDICCLVCDDWKNPEWDLGGHVHNWKNYARPDPPPSPPPRTLTENCPCRYCVFWNKRGQVSQQNGDRDD